jgi:16S rRNA (uracil1498-N3)-methyltransferase
VRDHGRPVFFAPREALLADVVRLDGAQGRHAASVRRMRVGEELTLADGKGYAAHGKVAAVVDKAGLDVDVLSRYTEPAPTPRIVVVQALPKGERGEVAVETLTEVGVDQIVPWQAQRCVTRWPADRAAKGVARWRASAAEAAKQSRRVWWPEVTVHESANRPLADVPVPDHGEIVILVGPEGGLTDAEVSLFAGAGGLAVRLGPTVLRTSTAGTVAAGIVLARTTRWR